MMSKPINIQKGATTKVYIKKYSAVVEGKLGFGTEFVNPRSLEDLIRIGLGICSWSHHILTRCTASEKLGIQIAQLRDSKTKGDD